MGPRRYFLLSILIAVALPLRAQQLPSVIVIVVDSLRPDHLQTYGYPRATSPEILRFSQKATVFTNAYSPSSWTRPAVEALITGEYPSELNGNPGGGTPLKEGHRTLATVLRSYGYATAKIFNSPQLTKELMNIGGFDLDIDYGVHPDTREAFVPHGVDQAIAFLNSARKSAFLFLHILDPHMPYEPKANLFGKTPVHKYHDPEEWITPVPDCDKDRSQVCHLALKPELTGEMQELYDSEIAGVDRELGRLLRFIESTPRYRDALTIITADHGEEFGEHGGLYHGARLYEETIRVPLIIRSPQRRYSIGRRVDSLVSLVDLVPTVLQAVSIPFSESDYSGESLLAFLNRRGGLPRDAVFVEKPGCACAGMTTVRAGDWKMIITSGRKNPFELYNLKSDPAEKKNLVAAKSPEVQKAMGDLSKRLETWSRDVTRPLASRNGDESTVVPSELAERLKALGYIQ